MCRSIAYACIAQQRVTVYLLLDFLHFVCILLDGIGVTIEGHSNILQQSMNDESTVCRRNKTTLTRSWVMVYLCRLVYLLILLSLLLEGLYHDVIIIT